MHECFCNTEEEEQIRTRSRVYLSLSLPNLRLFLGLCHFLPLISGSFGSSHFSGERGGRWEGLDGRKPATVAERAENEGDFFFERNVYLVMRLQKFSRSHIAVLFDRVFKMLNSKHAVKTDLHCTNIKKLSKYSWENILFCIIIREGKSQKIVTIF